MSEKEKVCIVTGVGPDKGTGAEIAKLFGKKKYKVAMIARNKKNLNDLEKKYKNIFSYPCDVGDLEKFKKTLKKIKNNLGPADVVIHNAPSASRGSILKLNPDDLELNFRVNTTALLHLVRETLPSMLSKKKRKYFNNW